MDLYAKLAVRVYKTLAKRGKSVYLRTITPGAYDTTTGTSTPDTPVDQERKGLVVDAPAKRVGVQYGQNFENGSLTLRTTKWVYIDGEGDVPTPGKLLVIDGQVYTIKDFQQYKPQSTVLLYLVIATT